MNEIIKKNSVIYGIIIALFSILVTASIYSIDLNLFINPAIGMFSMLIHIVIGVILVINTKKQLNKIISFKEVFSVSFFAGILGVTLSTLFNIILFNFIDPQAKETVKELSIKYALALLEKFDTPKEQINQALEKLNQTDALSIGNQIQGMLTTFAIIAIFALLLAAIFKTKTTQVF